MEYRYKKEVLDQLAVHGVRPTLVTPPNLVRKFLNDLYRFELRRLRNRFLQREIAKSNYYDRVIEVRRRYPLLSLKVWKWMESL